MEFKTIDRNEILESIGAILKKISFHIHSIQLYTKTC